MIKPQPVIAFDEARHLYVTDGLYRPSVTTILTFDESSFYKENGAKERGTVVHKMYEDYDNGYAVEDFYGEHYLEYLPPYLEFLSDYKPTYHGHEIRIFNDDLSYCGTIDRAGVINGRPFIADFKTGSSIPKWANLQTAAYALAFFENPEEVDRFVIHIHPPKLKTYKIRQYSNPTDFAEFTAKCNRYQYVMRQFEETLQ